MTDFTALEDVFSDIATSTATKTLPMAGLSTSSIVALIFLPVLAIYGVLGNALVCVSVVRFPHLRNVGNYYIVALAVADLLICATVLPFGIYQEVNNGVWDLPGWLCDGWIGIDVLMSTASIWLLCVISLDRYFAITHPHSYAPKRTTISAAIAISIAWVASLLVSLPVLLFVGGSNAGESKECYINVTPKFSIIGSMTGFFLPCTVVLVVYWRIFLAARKLSRPRVNPHDGVSAQGSSSNSAAEQNDNSKISFKKERKAAVVLAIVIGIFISCWIPFFTVYLLLGLCPQCEISVTTFKVVTWLGYCNSVLNPMIYTIFKEEFRKAFKKILFRSYCNQ